MDGTNAFGICLAKTMSHISRKFKYVSQKILSGIIDSKNGKMRNKHHLSEAVPGMTPSPLIADVVSG